MRSMLLILLLLLGACAGKSEKEDKTLELGLLALVGASLLPKDIPAPALNTATLILGNVQYTNNQLMSCTNGDAGIFIEHITGNSYPSLSLGFVNFNVQDKVTLRRSSNWILRIEQTATAAYSPESTCTAQIRENSTIIDIQAMDCALDGVAGNPDPSTNKISFRVRCTKQ